MIHTLKLGGETRSVLFGNLAFKKLKEETGNTLGMIGAAMTDQDITIIPVCLYYALRAAERCEKKTPGEYDADDVAIPRGQIAIAAGHAEPDAKQLVLKATRGQTDYGICSTTFLELAFRTDSYQITVDFHDDGSWSYVSDTTLTVKGQDEPFLHRDRNTLTKIAEPDLNPWAKITRGG